MIEDKTTLCVYCIGFFIYFGSDFDKSRVVYKRFLITAAAPALSDVSDFHVYIYICSLNSLSTNINLNRTNCC